MKKLLLMAVGLLLRRKGRLNKIINLFKKIREMQYLESRRNLNLKDIEPKLPKLFSILFILKLQHRVKMRLSRYGIMKQENANKH